MGDCIKFPSTTFTLMSSVAKYTRESEEAVNIHNEETDSVTDVLNLLDDIARQSLEEIKSNELDNYVFVLDTNEMLGDLSEFEDEEPICAVYIGGDVGDEKDEKPTYLLIISAERSYDADDYSEDEPDGKSCIEVMRRLIRLEENDKCSSYSFNENKWYSGGNLQKMYDYCCSDGPESTLLFEFGEYMVSHPLLLKEDVAVRLVENNTQLISLYNSLHGLADFEFTGCEGGKDPTLLLVPDDPNRRGSCARFENGEYVLYQYVTFDDCADAAFDAGYETCTGEVEPYFRPIYHESKQNRMQRALWLMWDRYSGDQTAFSIPLSAQTYIKTNRPFKRLPAYNLFGSVKFERLTEEEKKNYEAVKKHFRRVGVSKE